MSNSFDSTTLDTGNKLISKMAAENKSRWEEMITSQSTSAAKKYIQPYIHKVLAWTKQYHTKSTHNNLHSVHSRPCRIQEQSGPKNKQHYTTHGNAPKASGPYLRPKNSHTAHISTTSQYKHISHYK